MMVADKYTLSKHTILEDIGLIEDISKLFEESDKHTKRILWYEKSNYEMLYNEEDMSNISEYILAENSNYYTTTLINLNALYNRLNQLTVSPYRAENKECIGIPLGGECVKINSNNGSLYFKLPRLPKKAFRRFYFFEDELRYKLDRMWDTLLTFSFKKKVIRIVNVFNSKYNKYLIPDNDNYDFKRIIDIITDYLGGGDGGLTTSYFLESVVSDEVEEGSYIIISSADEPLKPTSLLLDDLKRFFL